MYIVYYAIYLKWLCSLSSSHIVDILNLNYVNVKQGQKKIEKECTS